MKKIIWIILRFIRIAHILQISYKGILDEYGWTKSFYAKQSIDRNGNPIPWYSYAAIDFLSDRITNQMDVFEFGAGNSTLWFSKRVKKVVSVEHNLEWFEIIKSKTNDNVEIIYKKLIYDDEYCRKARDLGEKFHVIIIDGRDRNNCIYNSIDSLTEDGIFIFDNTQRKTYSASIDFLINKGFKKIDFKGLCPCVAHSNITTIFYRERNCLGI